MIAFRRFKSDAQCLLKRSPDIGERRQVSGLANALQGVAGTSVYAATKGAIVALARTLAIDLAPRVRVSCIAPGAVDTEMIRAPRSEESLRELAALHPVGRIGTADEIAEAAEYLLEARFATGTQLVLDGGLTAA